MNNIIDSSAWLEYFADSSNAKIFAPLIEKQNNLIVPVITIYEVFKKVLYERDENTALNIIAHMKTGQLIDLTFDIAIFAAKLSKEYKLPMADSIILATAKRTNSIIWTQDSDFRNIDGVKYFKKK
jgi:predicted nucleic acid-binding protein